MLDRIVEFEILVVEETWLIVTVVVGETVVKRVLVRVEDNDDLGGRGASQSGHKCLFESSSLRWRALLARRASNGPPVSCAEIVLAHANAKVMTFVRNNIFEDEDSKMKLE